MLFTLNKYRHTLILFISVFSVLFISNSSHAASPSTPTKNSNNLIGHGGPVNTVAISPDGKTALSGSLDYNVMLWDLNSKKNGIEHRFRGHRGAVSAIAYAPNGDKAISTGDDGIVYLWDLKSRILQYEFKGHQGKVVSVSISNDSTLAVTSGWDGSVKI